MSHHQGPDKDTMQGLASLFAKQDNDDNIKSMIETLRLGVTGKFPQGTLTEEDEGEVRIATTAIDGKVILAFGKPIDWIGFDPVGLRELVQTLLDKAEECDGVKAVVRLIKS